MKNGLIFCFLTIAVVLTSCQKDDDCIAVDVMGTYEGTVECDEMSPQSITFEVVAGNSDTQIIVDGVTTVINDCDMFGSTVLQGTGREIDGDVDGNKISFVETVKVNGDVDFRCVWKGTKR